MSIVLAIFAVFIVVASGSAIIFPSEVLSFAREVMVGPGIWWTAFARLVLAVLLWFSAPACRTPKTFKVLAVMTVMGAVFLVAIGSEGLLEFIDWFASWPLWGVRLQTTVGVAFGLFLLWSIFSKRADA
ncbi:MAG: hypothetical protein V2I50_12635 [Desulfuromusa sp.]|jgi:hypothetical protein|nr:hypothetical protein [Desulfuromusa sp.]